MPFVQIDVRIGQLHHPGGVDAGIARVLARQGGQGLAGNQGLLHIEVTAPLSSLPIPCSAVAMAKSRSGATTLPSIISGSLAPRRNSTR